MTLGWKQWAAIGVVVAILAVFVWPTPYHTYLVRDSGNTHMERVNRFTGKLEYATREGWR